MANQNALNFITGQLIDSQFDQLDYPGLIDFLNALKVPDKNRIILTIKAKNGRGLGDFINQRLRAEFQSKAMVEAGVILADNALSSGEIDRVFQ